LHHGGVVPLVITAILPIVLLLSLGAVLRRRVVPGDAFWRGLERLTYYVFTPALFVGSIAVADLSAVPALPLAASVGAPIVAAAGLVLPLRRLLRIDGPALTSLLQGSVRINTYVGLVFASTMHGSPGVAVFALATAVLVPLVNVICVSVLAVYGARTGTGPRPRGGVWRELALNPLILSCAAGLALNLAGLRLPEFLTSLLGMLAGPAIACGTLIAGASIVLRMRRQDLLPIAVASVLRLLAVPLGAALLATQLGVSGVAYAVVVIISSVPTAPSAAVLAARLGGDVRLMAAITGVQTLLAAGTIPLVLHWAT
jgi:malonate transporter